MLQFACRSAVLDELLVIAMVTGGEEALEGKSGCSQLVPNVLVATTRHLGGLCASGGVGAWSEARNTAIPDAPDDTGRSASVH